MPNFIRKKTLTQAMKNIHYSIRKVQSVLTTNFSFLLDYHSVFLEKKES